jgi:hypothetical protein
MSGAKDLIIEGERKRAAANSVGLVAEELIRCDLICEEVYEQHSEDALKRAYRIGNSWITNGGPRVAPFKDTPADRRELTDILTDLWKDYPTSCRCRSQA